jgi:hypothetical protein
MNAELRRLSVVKIRYGDGAPLYAVCVVVPVYVLYVVAWSMLFATRSGTSVKYLRLRSKAIKMHVVSLSFDPTDI